MSLLVSVWLRKQKSDSFKLSDFSQKCVYEKKHVQTCVCVSEFACVLVCNQYLFCSDMNNRSIAWWLRQIGLPQYTKTLESEYYGLEVCDC